MVSDRSFRDSPEIAALPFPAYHQRPSEPTNLMRHHEVDLQQAITCGGVVVFNKAPRLNDKAVVDVTAVYAPKVNARFPSGTSSA